MSQSRAIRIPIGDETHGTERRSPFAVTSSCTHATLTIMKAYLITTGAVFALITLAHIARVFAEGPHLATDPLFIVLTVATAVLCFWACCLLWRSRRARDTY